MSIAPAAAFSLAALFVLGSAASAADVAPRRETPSGYPVPRFLSFRNAETNCRSGPSFQHPVAITYMQAGTPVLVVAETIDHWRKLRDVDGAECWAHESTLKARTHVIVTAEATAHTRPAVSAGVAARIAKGSLAEFDETSGLWTRVSVGKMTGWVETANLWGVAVDAATQRAER